MPASVAGSCAAAARAAASAFCAERAASGAARGAANAAESGSVSEVPTAALPTSTLPDSSRAALAEGAGAQIGRALAVCSFQRRPELLVVR